MIRPLVAGLLGLAFAAPLAAQQVCNPNIPEATPTGRFTFNDTDGTATDTRTGLVWRRCAEGQSGADCSGGSPLHLTWEVALRRARDSTAAGYTDWRLPNIKELDSIVEERCHLPTINLAVFPNTPSEWFWSSSPLAYYSGNAWRGDFSWGEASAVCRGCSSLAVRLVRGGQ